MRLNVAVILLAGLAAWQAPAQTGLPIIQPDAGFVLGIEWRRIVDSPIGVTLADEVKKSSGSQAPMLKELHEAFMHGIDSVVLSSPSAALSDQTKQPPVLAVIKGRFDLARIRGLLAAKMTSIEKCHAVELLAAPQDGANSKVALLDSGTILGGDRAQVCAAIDRIKSGHPAPPQGILDGIASLAAANDVWMVVQIPANATKNAPPQMAQMFSGVKSAELGMSFQQGFALRMNMGAKDSDSAKTIAQAIQGLVAMAAMSQAQSGPSLDFLKKVQVGSEGIRVKLELALDQREFEKLLKDAQATRQASGSPATGARPAELAPRKTIRISGLDGGPVEVPLSDTRK